MPGLKNSAKRNNPVPSENRRGSDERNGGWSFHCSPHHKSARAIVFQTGALNVANGLVWLRMSPMPTSCAGELRRKYGIIPQRFLP